MPNHRKSDNILQLTGAKRRNRKRYADRGNAPVDNRGIGRCPAFLTGSQKVAWKELVKNSPPGVLQRSDRIAVEMVARLMVQIREGDGATAATQAVLTSMLQKLGMTPTSRNSISIPAPEPSNPFADV